MNQYRNYNMNIQNSLEDVMRDFVLVCSDEYLREGCSDLDGNELRVTSSSGGSTIVAIIHHSIY